MDKMNVFLVILISHTTLFTKGQFVSKRRPVQPRIIGGHPVKRGERPYQLDLGYHNATQLCGATLVLSPGSKVQMGVTAAHCVTEELSKKPVSFTHFEVRGGKTGIKETGYKLNLTKVVIHPGYQPVSLKGSKNDIALLFFKGQFPLGKTIEPMALPKQGQKTSGHVSVSGWGLVSSKNESESTVLREVDLPVVNSRTCNSWYTDGQNRTMIYSTNFCAGYQEGNKTSCSGDSGGPVIGKDSKGHLYLAGIVSWGNKICEAPKSPAVFTRVSAYINWIKKEVNKYQKETLKFLKLPKRLSEMKF